MHKNSLLLISLVLSCIFFSAGSAQAAPVNQAAPTDTAVCGPITTDTTWTTAGSPYVITCFDVTVEAGVTLTVEPGVTVKGNANNIALTIKGHLQAVGTTEQPILFTSQMDSGAVQWLGIKVEGGTALLRHAIVRHGYDNISVRNVLSGEVRIEESRIEAAERYGVDSLSSPIAIVNTEFVNHTSQISKPLYVDAGDVGNLRGNRFEGNSVNRMYVRGSAVPISATWEPQTGMEAVEVEGRIDVNPGVILTLAPGTTVMGGGNGSFWVKGKLEAVGTAEAPILFTSAQNTGHTQWDGLNFDGGEGILRHVTVRYAFHNIYAINGARLDVQDSVLTAGGSDGMMVRTNSSATIGCSEITGNQFAGVYLDGNGTAVIVGSALTGNGNYGVQNKGTQNVDARYNWWGDPSGPGGVGPGTGNATTANVQVEPWLRDKRCVNPHAGYWDFGQVRIWADTFGDDGNSVQALGNVRLGSAATAQPYVTVDGSATFPPNPGADSKITVNGIATLIADQVPLGEDEFTVDAACMMTGAFVSEILIKGSISLPIQVSKLHVRLCTKDTATPGLYGQGVIPIGYLPNNEGKKVVLDFRFVEEQDVFHWRGEATADVVLKLAGGSYTAKFKVDNEGLLADSVKLDLPKIGDNSLSVEIKNLRIGLDGRLRGDIADFNLDLVGFALAVKKPGIDGNNRIQATSVKLTVKPELSSLKELRVAGSVTGLTIDDNGLHIEGGGFDLAFKIDKIGIAGKANFAPDPTATGVYLIKMDAEVKTPDFGVEAGVTLALISNETQVRRVFVAIQAKPPNSPTVLIEPNSQLYLYRLEGEMTLSAARQAIEITAKGKSLVEINKKPMLEATAGLTGEWHPKNYLKLHGTISVLKYPVGKASLLFTPTSVWLEGNLGIREDKIVLALLLKGALGLDGECEFTAVLQVEGETTLKAHALFFAVPPVDVTAKLGGTVGKHRVQATKQWGLRGYAEFPLIGKGWVWVGFSPGSEAQAGTGDGSDVYLPIWPEEAWAATAQNVNPHSLVPGISASVAADPLLYAQQDPATGEFAIQSASQFLLVEYLPAGAGMDAPALQLIRPDATQFAPPVAETSPENNARYYKVTNPQQGRWQVIAAPGAYVSVLASDPQPVVRSATVAARANGYQIDYEIADDDLLGDAMVWVEVIAPPAGDDTGQQITVDPTSGNDSVRCPGTGQVTASHVTRQDGLSAVGSVEWTPARLASGDYQAKLIVSNGVHTIVHDMGTINWQDTTPPAPPANLQATATADGALHVRWEAGDEDTSGYLVRIGDGSVLEQRGHHLNEFWTTGFNPGESTQVQVASVDPSSNTSPFVSVNAAWPVAGIAVQEWIPRAEDRRVAPGPAEVIVRFQEPTTINNFTVTGPSGALAGTWEPILIHPNTNAPVAVGGWWKASSGGVWAVGMYTAVVEGVDEGGEAFSVTWSWTVLESVGVPSDLYLPEITR